MDHGVQASMLADEFLAWEAAQDGKWEFDGSVPVAMNGGTYAHVVIQGNLIMALNSRLRGTPCRAVGSDLKVQIGSRYRYPDALVSCTRIAPGATVAADPVVIFEVLSDSTARIDWMDKMVEYRSLASVRRYVVLDQVKQQATSVHRMGDGWALDTLDETGTLAMPEIGIEVPISELYEDLDLS